MNYSTVATAGNLLAFSAILIAHFTGWAQIEGLVSIIIGCMMFLVVGKVFLDNARGAIGETDQEMLNHIAHLVLDDPNIKDIVRLEVIKEGEFLHVELVAEANPELSLAFLDDVRDHLTEIILSQKGVTRVVILYDEDDGEVTWVHAEDRPPNLTTK